MTEGQRNEYWDSLGDSLNRRPPFEANNLFNWATAWRSLLDNLSTFEELHGVNKGCEFST